MSSCFLVERAEHYFKDAYSLAGRDYNTYQIDNHFARLLLEKAHVEPSINDSFSQITEAGKIVLTQMTSEVRHYPFRVALGIFKAYRRFEGQWSREQNNYFFRIFKEIKRRCESANSSLRNHRYVAECLANANELLGSVGAG